MRIICSTILFLFLMALTAYAQNEATIWYFGDHAGLDFSSGDPQPIVNSAMRAEAGCTVISDKEGELQFYTNGKNVWNRNHQRMPNGFGLNGSQILNQNSIIVPLPDSDSIYYLFTINANYDSIGLNYSIVNMNREGGLGDIVLANQLMHRGFLEKISATTHCNGKDVWVMAHNRNNRFYCYLLTQSGIFQDTIISETGNIVKGDIGYMKISPSSNRVAFPVNYDSLIVEVFRFNNNTGKVFEPIGILSKEETVYAYGLEFSPDGNLLYVSTGGKNYRLWQYDLTRKTEQEINESATLLADGNHFAMQLAPDGKIYIAKQNRNYLSAINQPEAKGPACEYQEFAINLNGNNSLMGLPNFMATLFCKHGFSIENTCLGDTTYFFYNQHLNSDSVTWDFGDGYPPVTSTDYPYPSHFYTIAGDYNVKMIAYECGKTNTAEKQITISNYPEIDLGNDTSICRTCSIELDGGQGMDSWLWQDGEHTRYYEVNKAGTYIVQASKNGCIATDSINISEDFFRITMPNVFTPNNDGINDFFKPAFSQQPVSYLLQIFDRNGRLLFQSEQIDIGWDGKYQGYDSMIGAYVYSVIYSHHEENLLNQYKTRGTFVLTR